MPIMLPISDTERKDRISEIKNQIQLACPTLKVTEVTEHFLGAFVVKVELRRETPFLSDPAGNEAEIAARAYR